jgi:hypothetical protein
VLTALLRRFLLEVDDDEDTSEDLLEEDLLEVDDEQDDAPEADLDDDGGELEPGSPYLSDEGPLRGSPYFSEAGE